ncbi:MAG TPA: fluoride efflux transporter CrcB [Pyrinomonadaceae bacterium]|nr:fluoride efflux transporter CrcB [Pyrinomonadaceae bacterium]
MEAISKILAVAAGGALGAVARYLLNNSFLNGFLAPFPAATFFINITGSFAIGFLLTLTAEKFEISENLRLAMTVGFLGAYTTFSTFEFEAFELAREKHFLTAALYVVSSFAVGFAAVLAGVWTARRIG